MPNLEAQLQLERCPHCGVDRPTLGTTAQFETRTYSGGNRRFWRVYICSRCGGPIIAGSKDPGGAISGIYPAPTQVDESIPEPARSYLTQAINSMCAPAGSVMLSASSVDAMLKAKDYRDGSLYSRIDKAKDDHLITEEMALWAHEVRLDSNEPRHADDSKPLPTEEDARKSIDFVLALGQFLFVLPTRVKRGLENSTGSSPNS